MKYVNYIVGEGNTETGQWQDLKEFRLELEPGEFSLIWAAIQVRTKALKAAEKVFENYNHPEPLNIGGLRRVIEIGSAIPILEGKLLVNCEGVKEEPSLLETIRKGERTGYTWRLREEAGLQAMSSIGWLCDVAKARQPPITQSTSDINYEADLLPSNIGVKHEESPTGYNKKQITLMENTREFMGKILNPLPEIKDLWLGIPIIIFGQKLFRTTSKIFGSLPDLEEEERKKFDEMKNKVKAAGEGKGQGGG